MKPEPESKVSQDHARSAGSVTSGQSHTPIPEWCGYYATRDGRIYSSINWRGTSFRELKQDLNEDGYPSVRLTVIGAKRTRLAVHKLIATTFLGPRPSPAHEVRHLDGDRLNPHADNLAWGTRADNAADRERHGRTSRGEPHATAIKAGLAKSEKWQARIAQ